VREYGVGGRVAGGRPYAGLEELLAASDTAMAGLTAADLRRRWPASADRAAKAGDPVSAREQGGVREPSGPNCCG